MIQIEIYWNDLTEEAKRGILELLEVLGEEEESHNWDVFPIATIDIDDEED